MSTETVEKSHITEIKDLLSWEQTLASTDPSTLLIVSFHVPWASKQCEPMAAVLETLAKEYLADPSVPSTKWVRIDAEELDDVAEKYEVTVVPFLVLIRGGKVLETVSGSSAIKVRTAIETHAKNDPSSTGHTQTAPVAAPTAEAAVDPKEVLNQKLGELVTARPVMLFMKGIPKAPECGFSRQIVAILREHSVQYGFFNILADDEVRQGLKVFADWPTYPQLWMNGELVGGLDIVKEELSNDADFFKAYSVKNGDTTADSAAAA